MNIPTSLSNSSRRVGSLLHGIGVWAATVNIVAVAADSAWIRARVVATANGQFRS
jgi:hypothetical protein